MKIILAGFLIIGLIFTDIGSINTSISRLIEDLEQSK